MTFSSPNLRLTVLLGLCLAASGCDAEKSVAMVVSEPEDTLQHREILIQVSEDGALRFDGQPAELADISVLAGKSMSDSGGSNDESDPPLFIIAVGENVEYGLVINVMDELQKVGANNVEIAAAPKN